VTALLIAAEIQRALGRSWPSCCASHASPVGKIGSPKDLFQRFTDRARRAVHLAQEEARLLRYNYVGTEHPLLGLLYEGEGVAAQALGSLGVSLQAVRGQVEQTIGHGPTTPAGHIPFTPRAKKVLELSLREALALGHNYIGTEHLLLGLVREGEGLDIRLSTVSPPRLTHAPGRSIVVAKIRYRPHISCPYPGASVGVLVC
jgi:hypothetical protein